MSEIPWPSRRRGRDESSTEFGQFVHNELDRDFDWVDDDFAPGRAYTYAKSTRILRLIEHKYPGQSLTNAERRELPLWARLLELGVEHGVIEQGCVVIVTCNVPPGKEAALQHVLADGTVTARAHFDPATLHEIVGCRPVDWFLCGRCIGVKP